MLMGAPRGRSLGISARRNGSQRLGPTSACRDRRSKKPRSVRERECCVRALPDVPPNPAFSLVIQRSGSARGWLDAHGYVVMPERAHTARPVRRATQLEIEAAAVPGRVQAL